MEFIKDSLVFQKCPKSTMFANHATNYSYKNVRFASLTILK